jgi:hypothetical protein
VRSCSVHRVFHGSLLPRRRGARVGVPPTSGSGSCLSVRCRAASRRGDRDRSLEESERARQAGWSAPGAAVASTGRKSSTSRSGPGIAPSWISWGARGASPPDRRACTFAISCAVADRRSRQCSARASSTDDREGGLGGEVHPEEKSTAPDEKAWAEEKSTAPAVTGPMLAAGSSGPAVRRLQLSLAAAGFAVSTDGVFGPRTRRGDRLPGGPRAHRRRHRGAEDLERAGGCDPHLAGRGAGRAHGHGRDGARRARVRDGEGRIERGRVRRGDPARAGRRAPSRRRLPEARCRRSAEGPGRSRSTDAPGRRERVVEAARPPRGDTSRCPGVDGLDRQVERAGVEPSSSTGPSSASPSQAISSAWSVAWSPPESRRG